MNFSQNAYDPIESIILEGGLIIVGVYWPDVDEDLSLKGLLSDELMKANQFI